MGCDHQGGDGSGGTAERFMEMGIGMALARQMGQMVNQTMAQTMQNPPAQTPTPQRLYYAGLEGRQAGPFSETEIVRLINEKRIARETLVWSQGMKEWKQAQDVPEILRIIALGPPPFEGGTK
ncbi:hypothetical protein AGMMS49944_10820 [Spirochaetia bacterium]|nr:hypothetical protein AGMMS49944_10820 [Spirochaetia bacterium]